MKNWFDKQKSFQEKVQQVIKTATCYLQYIMAAAIVIGIVLQLIRLPEEFRLLRDVGVEEFRIFLQYVIDLVIGIELIHLLCQPNLDNVVEILLIAITREIVLTSTDSLGYLLGALSIAVLFAVRKYLFIDKLDRHDEDFSSEKLQAVKEHEAEKAASGQKSEEKEKAASGQKFEEKVKAASGQKSEEKAKASQRASD